MPEESEAAAPDEGSQEQGAEEKGPEGLEGALARARETLGDGGSLADAIAAQGEEDDDGGTQSQGDEGDEEGSGPEEESDEEGSEGEEDDGGSEEEVNDDDADEEGEAEGDGDGDEEGSDEEGEGKEGDDAEAKTFTVAIPARHPGDDDIEIEVGDKDTAERIAQLRNGFMHGEQYRAGLTEIQGAQEELQQIEEHFDVDAAGFVLEHISAEQHAQVALALLTDAKIWETLAPTITKLLDNPDELRILQAESKAERLETRERLKEAVVTRREHAKNGAELREAIALIIPEEMSGKQGETLSADLTRDLVDHIKRNKLGNLKPRDMVTIVADRLEANGIDPLDARKAIKNGSRNGAKTSTRRRPKKKAKSGNQLVKASAKRKKFAAAPGPGKKTAPTEAKKLPAGQTIKERVALARKEGLAALTTPS